MKFHTNLTLRGKQALSWIEKDEKSNRINIKLDPYGNKSAISFDSICFNSFSQAMNEYREKGKVTHNPSESCQGQFDLEALFLDLSKDKRFSARLDLGNGQGNCVLTMKPDHAQISICFNENQLIKIMDKFKNAINGKEALRESEKEIII